MSLRLSSLVSAPAPHEARDRDKHGHTKRVRHAQHPLRWRERRSGQCRHEHQHQQNGPPERDELDDSRESREGMPYDPNGEADKQHSEHGPTERDSDNHDAPPSG